MFTAMSTRCDVYIIEIRTGEGWRPVGDAALCREALDEISAERGSEVGTVALAWLRQQPTVVAPIASASTVEQVPGLLATGTLELTTAELERLSALTV